MENDKHNVKGQFLLLMNKYLSHIFTFILSTFLFVYVFLMYSENITLNFNGIKLINQTDTNQVAFVGLPVEKNCFINLNGKFNLVNDKNINLNSDVYMVIDNVEYTDNLIQFYTHNLLDNQCVVSENILKKFNFKIGDKISIFNTDFYFEIVGSLPPQSGVDKDFAFNGVVVLGHNSEVVKNLSYNFIMFAQDEYQFFELEKIIFLESYQEELTKQFVTTLCIFIAISICWLFVAELILGVSRRRRYKMLFFNGLKLPFVWLNIFIELLIMYILPILIAFFITLSVNWGFIASYISVGLIVLSIVFVEIIAVSLLYIWRIKSWKRHRR